MSNKSAMSNKSDTVLIDALDVPVHIKQKLASHGASVATINEEITLLKEFKDAIMDIVEALAAEYDIPNIKKPGVFDLTLCQGKLTLKEQLLLENSVPASVIEASKERGNPYWQVKRAKAKKEAS